MRYLLIALLCFPLTANATVYHYTGDVSCGIYEDGPGPGFRDEGFTGGTMDLTVDTDALTWSLQTSFADPSDFDLDVAGRIPSVHELGTWGPYQVDAATGDYKMNNDVGGPRGSIVLHGVQYAAYGGGDFLSSVTGSSFSMGAIHTTNTDGAKTWIDDYYLGGSVTCDVSQGATPQSSPVPEPATAGLLLLGALVRRRLHPEA